MTDNPAQRDRHRARTRTRRLPLWWLLPTGALLGAAAGGAYGVLKPPQYTATSSVVAVAAARSDVDCADALGFAQAYGRVAPQLAVLGDAQVAAGVPAAKLRESVQVATSPDAPMVSVSATSSSPGKAVDMADAVSAALVTQASHTKASTGVRLERLSRALTPTEPSSVSPKLAALVGASAGGLLGGLVLLARPRRTEEDGPGQATVPAPTHAADARGTLG